MTARLADAGTIGQLLTGQVGQRFPVVDPCGSRCNTTGAGARRSSGALRRRRTAGQQSRAPPVAGQACGAVGATPPRGGHRLSSVSPRSGAGVKLTPRVTIGGCYTAWRARPCHTLSGRPQYGRAQAASG